MRNTVTVCLALAVPTLLLASALQPMTVLPDETSPVDQAGPITSLVTPAGTGGGESYVIGIVDTVGGTTYDWQNNGPAYRQLVNSAEHGIHVAWMYSASDQTTFPDRNMRYNFYDYTTRTWNWIEPGDHMQSGVNVFTERCGFGNLDADPATGVAVVSAHLGTPIYPEVARDMAPGAGLFEYCPGDPTMSGYLWPYISVGQNSAVHCACIDDASQNMIFYSKVDPWCTWADPVGMAAPQPDPNFPDQNVAASKVSDKVCVTWVYSPDGYSQKPGFYRISTDGGSSWEASTELLWPDAYGTDTLTSFHITSLFPFYDLSDMLHIVASVAPFVRDTNWILPAEIWHWDEGTDAWTEIFRGCDSIMAPIGYNAIVSCRPSMGTDMDGNLFVAWENFDGLNYEPGPPERLRADIFWSYSTDNGAAWETPEKITDGGEVTYRFPCMMDYITDTVAVAYLLDDSCGFYLYAEGPATNNPIIVQRWENPVGGGVAEKPRVNTLRMTASAAPNPFDHSTRISWSAPYAGDVSLVVYDMAGRSVRTLVSGRTEPGRFTVAWDGRDDQGSEVAAGVYLYKYALGTDQATGKLLLAE